MNKFILPILLLFSSIGFGQSKSTKEQNSKIDTYIEYMMDWKGIPGIALAVVKDNKIIHKKNYGYASLEHQVPVSDQSIFRVYSLTKPIVAVGLFQLIESGKLSLEDEISKFVPNLPDEWQSIQIKHLLAHSSGLPDMSPIPEFQNLSEEEAKEKIFSKDCKFKPGTKYDYNQTGFWLLQKVIEKIENTDMASWIESQQFSTSNDTAFFSSDSRDIVIHRATPYFPFTKKTTTIDHSYLQGTYAHAMNGLNISLGEFIRWDEQLRKNKLIKKKTKAMMWQSFPYTDSDKLFTYGWDRHATGGHISYGFSGSLVTAYRVFSEDNVSIILLSNGLGKFYNIENVINHIAEIVLKE